ncbi:cation-translocating P-type ATPase [Virgibacillus sp. NKC19-3]|uniref:heavy metal translocating P-type ATPase n=1 Tax=Virgibacillus saliphilus TaxID=2831674 RepID=UPI001C9A6CA8|nr:cation-translocating P-type ATPase [Virgibacillus sp. NKC19-3]MBY7142043.1 cation-translocating P-type ATPase [Virgibacillus sp. NKC19-3]
MRKVKRVHVVITSGSLLILAFLFHLIDMSVWKDITLIAATFIAGYFIAKKAIQTTMMKAFSIELLVTIAVIGALSIGEYVESAAVTFLFLFGAYLEARTLEKTRSSLQTLMGMAPMEATVLENGERIVKPIRDIDTGDHILIQTGEKVAIDGKIISGQAFINESTITGESILANKNIEDQVFSGTMIDHGYVEVEAEKVGDDTAFSKIIELVEEAQESKAKTQKFLDRFANVYTPGILVLSILVLIVTQNFELSITFLVIACPGALVISTPVSLVAGIGNGAKNGTLMKGGEIIENLAKIDVLVFDKTGTLTKGEPEMTGVKAYDRGESELLTMTAEAEIISEHHLGRAIVKEAKRRGLPLLNEPEEFTLDKGHGLCATIDGQSVVIGNRKLLRKNEIELPLTVETYAIDEEEKGNTAIFVGINEKLAGVISIADQIRQEATSAMQHLKDAGIKQTVMLTGDNKHTAEKVATQLGIDDVFAEMLPEDKVNHVQHLKVEGYNVSMVGDGVNDAPAIAAADVGMAMGAAGTDAAMETADVVLMTDKLDKIPYAYTLAKATVRNMKQNIFIAVGTVALLLAGVLVGEIFLASGMFIHELSVLMVILNAIRLVGYKQRRRVKQKQRRTNTAVI